MIIVHKYFSDGSGEPDLDFIDESLSEGIVETITQILSCMDGHQDKIGEITEVQYLGAGEADQRQLQEKNQEGQGEQANRLWVVTQKTQYITWHGIVIFYFCQ